MSTTHPPASATLGADILLARHGQRIVAWRMDRSGERTRAKLSDGSWDSAPNSLVLPGQSPANRAAMAVERWGAAREGERRADERKAERRFFGRVIAVWAVASAVIMVGLMAWAGSGVDPALLEQLMTAPGV